ncbi:hypothetical protein Hanom_Chr03g00183391 [Helianthus anomalus]
MEQAFLLQNLNKGLKYLAHYCQKWQMLARTSISFHLMDNFLRILVKVNFTNGGNICVTVRHVVKVKP